MIILGGWTLSPAARTTEAVAATPALNDVTNTHALGQLIYTHYIYLFQVAGLILLIAMIGAIVLTHRQRPGVRRQDIARQVARRPEDTIEVRKVPSGKGI